MWRCPLSEKLKKKELVNQSISDLQLLLLILHSMQCIPYNDSPEQSIFIPKAFGKARRAYQSCLTLRVTWAFVIPCIVCRMTWEFILLANICYVVFLKRAQIQTNPLILHMKAEKRARPTSISSNKGLYIPNPDQHFQSKKIYREENFQVGEIYVEFVGQDFSSQSN